jgi:hypothetical protein
MKIKFSAVLFFILTHCISTLSQINIELHISDVRSTTCIDTLIVRNKNSVDTLVNISLAEYGDTPYITFDIYMVNNYTNDSLIWLRFSKFYVSYFFNDRKYEYYLTNTYLGSKPYIENNESVTFSILSSNAFDQIWSGTYDKSIDNETKKHIYRKDYTHDILDIISSIELKCLFAVSRIEEEPCIYNDTYFIDKFKTFYFYERDFETISIHWEKCNN